MGKVILVTGASSGIGHCCAAHLAAQGHQVYGASRSGTAAGFDPLVMDVTSDASVIHAVRTILEREGRIDAVINNAGYGISGAVEDTTIEEARQQFDANFFGVMRVCRAVLPAMRQRRQGALINIGSIGGLIAIPYQGLYSASKFALEGMTEALRLELRQFNIRVSLIEPGDHRTGFTQNRRAAQASGRTSAYHPRFEKAVARMAADEQAGPGPEPVALLAERILNSPHPRLRYTIGPAPQRLAVWLKRLTPYSLTERILRSYYG